MGPAGGSVPSPQASLHTQRMILTIPFTPLSSPPFQDLADLGPDGVPRIEHLWDWKCPLTTGAKVSCMAWNKKHQDLLAVGYGNNSFHAQTEGSSSQKVCVAVGGQLSKVGAAVKRWGCRAHRPLAIHQKPQTPHLNPAQTLNPTAGPGCVLEPQEPRVPPVVLRNRHWRNRPRLRDAQPQHPGGWAVQRYGGDLRREAAPGLARHGERRQQRTARGPCVEGAWGMGEVSKKGRGGT